MTAAAAAADDVVTSMEADDEPSVYSVSSFSDVGRLLRKRFLKLFDDTAGRRKLRTKFCFGELL